MGDTPCHTPTPATNPTPGHTPIPLGHTPHLTITWARGKQKLSLRPTLLFSIPPLATWDTPCHTPTPATNPTPGHTPIHLGHTLHLTIIWARGKQKLSPKPTLHFSIHPVSTIPILPTPTPYTDPTSHTHTPRRIATGGTMVRWIYG